MNITSLRKVLFGAAITLLLSVTASAHTLRSVVQHTICTNPQVLAATKVMLASNETVKQARAGFYPIVDFNAGVSREKTDNSNTRGDERTLWRRELGLRLRQNLFQGFFDYYEVKRNKAKTDADSYAVWGVAEDQALLATEAYLNVLRQEELVEVARENLATHVRINRMVEQRAESGVGREADIHQAKGRLALAKSNLYAVENDQRNIRTNFHRVTGIEASSLSAPTAPADNVLPSSKDQAVRLALQNHPKMKVAVVDVEEARAQHSVAHSTAFPIVDLVLEANKNNNVGGTRGRDDNYLAGLQLTYNLFRGGKDIARQRETAYFTQEASEIRNRTCRQTVENMRLSWSNWIATKERIPTLREHKEASAKTSSAYKEQFRLGKRTLLDLLDVENEKFNSAQEDINGRYDEMIAKYRILAAMGQLTRYLQVTLPTSAKEEYDTYEAVANPVSVKRHFEADIHQRDKPSKYFNKERIEGDPTIAKHDPNRVGHLIVCKDMNRDAQFTKTKGNSIVVGHEDHEVKKAKRHHGNHHRLRRGHHHHYLWGRRQPKAQSQPMLAASGEASSRISHPEIAQSYRKNIESLTSSSAPSSSSTASNYNARPTKTVTAEATATSKPDNKSGWNLFSRHYRHRARSAENQAKLDRKLGRRPVPTLGFAPEKGVVDTFDVLKPGQNSTNSTPAQATEVAKVESKPAEQPKSQTAAATIESSQSPLAASSTIAQHVEKTGPEMKGWAVQIGTFDQQSEVNKLVGTLKKNGLNGFMREISTGKNTTIELFIGPTKERSEAKHLVAKLKKLHLGGSIVRAES